MVSFPEFIECFLKNELDKIRFIKGIFCKEGLQCEGSSQTNCNYGEEYDINSVVELDYTSFLDSIDRHFANDIVRTILLFETSRGCSWGEKCQCTFCGLNGDQIEFRNMQPEKALNYINTIIEKFSDRCKCFEAVDNVIPKEYVDQVFKLLKLPDGARIFTETRVWLTEQEIETLAKTRVDYIQPGIETLDSYSLKLMKKGTTVFQNLMFLKNSAQYGLNLMWNILVAFPGEEIDSYYKYLKDIPKIRHFYPPRGVFPISYQRNSEYFKYPEKYDLDLTPVEYYKFIYPFSEESLWNYAYYFENYKFGEIFTLKRMKMMQKVINMVTDWNNSWKEPDANDLVPELYIMEDKEDFKIYDSRSGKKVVHEIDKDDKLIITGLDVPMTKEELFAELNQISLEILEEKFSVLEDKGFFFEDKSKYLSLVLAREPLYPKNYEKNIIWKE